VTLGAARLPDQLGRPPLGDPEHRLRVLNGAPPAGRAHQFPRPSSFKASIWRQPPRALAMGQDASKNGCRRPTSHHRPGHRISATAERGHRLDDARAFSTAEAHSPLGQFLCRGVVLGLGRCGWARWLGGGLPVAGRPGIMGAMAAADSRRRGSPTGPSGSGAAAHGGPWSRPRPRTPGPCPGPGRVARWDPRAARGGGGVSARSGWRRGLLLPGRGRRGPGEPPRSAQHPTPAAGVESLIEVGG
jgi:hypothetical protein